MINFTNCSIEDVSVHHIGNKTNGEELILSKSPLDTSETRLRELLLRYFLSPFSSDEYYSFTFSNGDFTMNPIFRYVSNLFDSPQSIHNISSDIAKHLYELSLHPQIKSGDLFIVFFSDFSFNGEFVSAIGVFKSEKRHPFLRLGNDKNDFFMQYDDGINIEKLDKGCIILNTDKQDGFKICIIDRSNKSNEAQFWKESFLNVKPCKDDYHHTKGFLNIAKKFVTDQLTEDFEVSKADQIDFLNRSVDYFKNRETFDKQEFEEEVFGEGNVIESFRRFDQTYRQENELDLSDSFEISAQAVKKQARVFKSVLKLDKNFHIYIHGNRELIEQGTDENGRKYYKIYYEQES